MLFELDDLIEEEPSPAAFGDSARLGQVCARLARRQKWGEPQADLSGEMADAQRIGAS